MTKLLFYLIATITTVSNGYDICLRNQCKNGASCRPLSSKEYKCECNPNFRGIYCQFPATKLTSFNSSSLSSNPCQPNPCYQNATCTVMSTSKYRCNCPIGWAGTRCENNVDDCANSPCKNRGKCIDLTNHRYRCECPLPFSGMHCQYRNPCHYRPGSAGSNFGSGGSYSDNTGPNPCGVHGTCVPDNEGEDSTVIASNKLGYRCHCNPGYTGPTCSIDVNECASHDSTLCENGGTCINTLGSYKCNCVKGFSGDRCEIDIRECRNDTCKNGGTCLDKIGRYECICTEYFRGKNCEKPIPICEKRPCKNNGKCRELGGTEFYCSCEGDWQGKTCELRLNSSPCANNANICQNGGVCIDTENSMGKKGYRCECKSGYSGTHCDVDINDCTDIKCLNGGTCIDQLNGWRCNCLSNFHGRYCELPLKSATTNLQKPENEAPICRNVKCRFGGICKPVGNDPKNAVDYRCQCPSGLTGKHCEENINDCIPKLDESGRLQPPCKNGGTCEDRIDGFVCHCPNGFIGLHCENVKNVCSQVGPLSECAKIGQKCQNDQTASRGFRCVCEPGKVCREIKVIQNCTKLVCQNGGVCNKKEGIEKCICKRGYTGLRCETEINECFSNPCQHGGKCHDLIGNYACDCLPGYEGKNCEINIDECAGNPCGPNGHCQDAVNNYWCQCYPPYSGTHCQIKLDPCRNHRCQHEALCIPNRQYTNYNCNCSTAFGRYSGDQCQTDVDECQLDRKGLKSYQLLIPNDLMSATPFNVGPCFNNGTCINTDGSFVCRCPLGYHGDQCQFDTDDCLDYPCKNGAICVDKVNSYQCNCPPGFKGKNCEIDIDECAGNPCQNGAKCIDHINDYQCICKPGFSSKNCEINDNDCTNSSCAGFGKCIDMVNDFRCECYPGYYGRYCQYQTRPCDNSPCLNNGSCKNLMPTRTGDNYSCSCRQGYFGPRCESRMNWCRGSPCGEKGRCIDLSDIKVDDDSDLSVKVPFRCQCDKGYYGERCELRIGGTCGEYAKVKFGNSSSVNKVCEHGDCVDRAGEQGFYCACRKGYKGTFCKKNINYCANQPCQNGGVCKDGIGMYTCECQPGFLGLNCQKNRDDCTINPCKHGICVDQINNYTCICPPGTNGRHCEVIKDFCEDVTCKNGGKCISKVGGFRCECDRGFSGRFCEVDINECRYNIAGDIVKLISNKDTFVGPCSPRGTLECIDARGGYKCKCKQGFAGNNCEKKVGGCHGDGVLSSRLCFNGGTCQELKSSDKTSSKLDYRCICPPGFGGKMCQVYSKDCSRRPPICLNGGVCRPLELKGPGGAQFRCECLPGVGGIRCELDYRNECAPMLDGSKVCYNGGHCLDGPSKPRCLCRPGTCGKRCEIDDATHCSSLSVVGKNRQKYNNSYTKELKHCLRNRCTSKVNNKRCDPECNFLACDFDGRECLHRVPKVVRGHGVKLAQPWSNCTIIRTKNIPCHHYFMNGKCNPECNTEQCLFDGWDCEKKINPCPRASHCAKLFENGVCNNECNIVECNYDGGDCDSAADDNRDGKNKPSKTANITGSLILILPVSTDDFVNIWEQKLLSSLSKLLHALVRIKRYNDGEKMIISIRVFVESGSKRNNLNGLQQQRKRQQQYARSKRSINQKGRPGTKVYLQLENSICVKSKSSCFDNTNSAAEFVSAAMYRKSYKPPVPILSVQAESGDSKGDGGNSRINAITYIVIMVFFIIITGILAGVLYGFTQNQRTSSKPKENRNRKAEIWYPEGMKRKLIAGEGNNTSSEYNRRLASDQNAAGTGAIVTGASSRKRSALMSSANNSATVDSSVDDSNSGGSHSLTSTRITSYELSGATSTTVGGGCATDSAVTDRCQLTTNQNSCINNNVTTNLDDIGYANSITMNGTSTPLLMMSSVGPITGVGAGGCSITSSASQMRVFSSSQPLLGVIPASTALISPGDSKINFVPSEKKAKYSHMNDFAHFHQDFESSCFEAISQLLLSGSGLGDLSLTETRDKQLMLEKLLKTAAAASTSFQNGTNFYHHNFQHQNSQHQHHHQQQPPQHHHQHQHHQQQHLNQIQMHPNNNNNANSNINNDKGSKFPYSASAYDISNMDFSNNVLIGILTKTTPTTGETLLHLAARFNRREAAKVLVDAGSNPNAVDMTGRSCLMMAVDAGAYEVAAYLLEQNVFQIDLHLKGPSGTTCLMQAIKCCHLDIVELILRHMQPEECDLNITDDFGRTALHWGAATDQPAVVQCLIAFGFNRDAQDAEEMTPLYLACSEGCTEVVRVLLMNGANPDMSDHMDCLPIDIARKNGLDDIVKMLEHHALVAKETLQQQHQQNSHLQGGHHHNNAFHNVHPNYHLHHHWSGQGGHNPSAGLAWNNNSHGPGQYNFRNNYTNAPWTSPSQMMQLQHQQRNNINNHSNMPNHLSHIQYEPPSAKLNPLLLSPLQNKMAAAAVASRNYGNGYVVTNSSSNNTNNGLTPSPADSESPGHWSTSSPSLSPRSRSQHQQKLVPTVPPHSQQQQSQIQHQRQQQQQQQQHQQPVPVVNSLKSSVLHYHPSPIHEQKLLQNNALYNYNT